MNADRIHIPVIAPAIPGVIALFVATGAFGIGWLATVWLIPTEIFPTTARAQVSFPQIFLRMHQANILRLPLSV
jgi:hypothetical protein